MRTLYLDCFSGISGDMLLGALLACGVSADELRSDLDTLGMAGWSLETAAVTVEGIAATGVTVHAEVEPGHGRHLADIEGLIGSAALPGRAAERAIAVFGRLAEAEARVHATTPQSIHFHEVGAIDAIVDIVGCCALIERLGITDVRSSPLPMGRGFVQCAHGTIPLPAPAVVELTAGAPVYGVDFEGELVTPTGAALATTLACGYGPIPAMVVETSGYGAGKKRFPGRPNLLRAVVGRAELGADPAPRQVTVLEANIDDLSPQFFQVVLERLFAAGALDAYLTPVQMKKGRPGVLVTALCEPGRADALTGVLFAETPTLGVRTHTATRDCLQRDWVTVPTAYGDVRIKRGLLDGRVVTASPEYADVKAAADASGAPARQVHIAALLAYERQADR